MTEWNDEPIECASSPCMMQDLDAHYAGSSQSADSRQLMDVDRWRRARRRRLLDERQKLGPDERREFSAAIRAALDTVLGDPAGRTIGAYWPIRGEPDLRPWMESLIARGGFCALPALVGKNTALDYGVWIPGAAMAVDGLGIPAPRTGATVTPSVLVVPVLGFDHARHRLGYGGGHLLRSLSCLSEKPCIIGVGFSLGASPTIYPRPDEIPMDVIVTECEILAKESMPLSLQATTRVKVRE